MMGAPHLLAKGRRDLGNDSKAARPPQSPSADGNPGKAAARLRSEGGTCGQDSTLVALSGSVHSSACRVGGLEPEPAATPAEQLHPQEGSRSGHRSRAKPSPGRTSSREFMSALGLWGLRKSSGGLLHEGQTVLSTVWLTLPPPAGVCLQVPRRELQRHLSRRARSAPLCEVGRACRV